MQLTELHGDLVYKYILKRIRKAVREDMSYVTLFQFGPSRKLAQLSRHEYETQLNTLMTYFVKKENYELAARCRDTLARHKQNESRRPS
jgi:excinuclease UvrABC helicase subunit UvrB